MNPADFSEDTITFFDRDVDRGLHSYFVKGISAEGLESTNAAEVDINILQSKGSFFNENPQVPQYPMDTAHEIIDNAAKLHTYIELKKAGNRTVTSITATGWTTVLDVSAQAGVFEFLAIGAKNFDGTSGLTYGCRVTLDGKQLINFQDIPLDAVGAHEEGFILVGFLMFDSSTTIVAGGNDYIPFDESLKIEAYTSDYTKAKIATAHQHYETF